MRLLQDIPAEVDKFGAHTECAKTIVNLLDAQEGGIAIGLVGSWGSGKSTVVKLLRGLLAPRKETVVLVFDTWAHEGDPLRRSFLELLVAGFEELSWINSGIWKRRLARLSGVEKAKTETTHPILTAGGWLYLVFAFVSPLGAILFADAVRKGLRLFLWSAPISWQAVLGLLLFLLPFLVAAVELASLAHESKGAVSRLGYVREHLAERLSPFTKQGSSSSETISREDGEPTSIEFAKLYGELVREALNRTDKHLVVVVDNLDRVDRPTALTIWSTLQAFLAPNRATSTQGRISVVLPYDRQALRRIWTAPRPDTGSAPIDREAGAGIVVSAPSQASEDELKAVAESQIAKALQVVVEVPRPVLANWREYLVEALQQVFPANHSDQEFHRIYQLYDSFLVDSGAWATPRDVKLFANELAALHARTKHEFPLVHQAFYVLVSRFHGDVADWVRTQSPTARQLSLAGPDAKQSLAAIAFGVPRGDAFQVLVGQDVRALLQKGDGKGLRALSQQGVGVDLLVDRTLDKVIEETEEGLDDSVTNTIRAVQLSGIAEATQPVVSESIVSKLVQALQSPKVTVNLAEGVPESIAWLLLRGEAKAVAHLIVDKLSAATSRLLKEGDAVSKMSSLTPLLSAIANLRATEGGLKELVLACDGPREGLFALAVSAAETTDDHLRVLLTPPIIGAIVETLESEGAAGRWSVANVRMLAALRRTSPTTESERVERALGAVLRSESPATPDEIMNALESCDLLEKDAVPRPTYDRILKEGHLYTHLARASDAGHKMAPRTIALHLIDWSPSLEIEVSSEGASRGREALISAGPELVESIVQGLVQVGVSQKLLAMDRPGDVRALGVRLVAELSKHGPPPSFVTPHQVIEHWDYLREADGDKSVSLGGKSSAQVVQALVGDTWNEAMWPTASTLWGLSKAEAKRQLEVWLRQGLSKVEKEEWVTRLKAGDESMASLFGLAEWLPKDTLSFAWLRDAAVQVCKENLGAGEESREVLSRCLRAVARMSPEDGGYVRRTLADALVARGTEVADTFIDVFGAEIGREQQPFVSGTLVRQSLIVLVEAGRQRGVQWVESLAVDRDGPLHKAIPGDLKALREALQSMAAAASTSQELKETALRAVAALPEVKMGAKPKGAKA